MREEIGQLVQSLPQSWAMPAAFVAFAVLLLVVWMVPRDSVLSGAPDRAAWRDLRIWATVLVGVQLLVYLATG